MRLEKTYETWEHKLVTYMYNHCNTCNIAIYFCNIRMKTLCNIPLKYLKHLNIRLQYALLAQCHLAAWTNERLSLRSSMPARRSAAAHGARRCGSGAALLRFSNACSWPKLAPVGPLRRRQD